MGDLNTIARHLIGNGLDKLRGELLLSCSLVVMCALMLLRKAMLAAETLITLGACEVTEGELLAAAGATIGGCHSGCRRGGHIDFTCVHAPRHFCR